MFIIIITINTARMYRIKWLKKVHMAYCLKHAASSQENKNIWSSSFDIIIFEYMSVYEICWKLGRNSINNEQCQKFIYLLSLIPYHD